MGTFLLGLFTVVLLIMSVFIVLIVLMQRASSNAGMGSALGGGAAEAAFGGGSANVLSRFTIAGMTIFFVITFLMYLGYMAKVDGTAAAVPHMPEIQEESGATVPAEPVRRSGLTEFDAPLPEAEAKDAEEAVTPPQNQD